VCMAVDLELVRQATRGVQAAFTACLATLLRRWCLPFCAPAFGRRFVGVSV
jgi:hypothetical protein